jgi:MFS family permease
MLVRRIMPKIGEKTGAIAGFLGIAAGMATLAFAQSIGVVYAGLAVLGMGSGFTNVGLSALVSLYSDAKEQGRALGIYRSLGSLARAMGPLWAGIVFWRFGARNMYLVAACLMSIPFIVGARLPRPAK